MSKAFSFETEDSILDKIEAQTSSIYVEKLRKRIEPLESYDRFRQVVAIWKQLPDRKIH